MIGPLGEMEKLVSLNQIINNARIDFIRLLQKSLSLNEKYKNYYRPEDARPNFFITYFNLNLWLLIQFDSFLDILDRGSNRISRYVQLTEQDRTQFFDTI
jgi:hypothetical protein